MRRIDWTRRGAHDLKMALVSGMETPHDLHCFSKMSGRSPEPGCRRVLGDWMEQQGCRVGAVFQKAFPTVGGDTIGPSGNGESSRG